MADQEITEQIKSAFRKPLPDGESRRVIFWHDVAGSFQDDYSELAEGGVLDELPRPVVLENAEGGSLFELKRQVLREHPDDDFLIYTRQPRDFSEGGLAGNWLTGIEFGSEHFQADRASMMLGELNASGAAQEAIASFGAFFKSAGRRQEYLKRVPETVGAADVSGGVVAVLLKAPTARMEGIAKALLVALHAGDAEALRETFAKYDADEALRALLKAGLGYSGDAFDERALAAHLLMSAASCTLPEQVLHGYEAHVSKQHARYCLNVVRDWLNDDAARSELYEICRMVERETNLPAKLEDVEIGSLLDCDVFPCVNEAILAGLMGSLAQGSDRCAEALSTQQRRKDLKWYKRVSSYFDVLAAGAEAEAFRRSHAEGFHETTGQAAWDAYTGDWCRMDGHYRRFCTVYDRCLLVTEGIPDALRDAADALADWVERIYANWYLVESNSCWTNVCEDDWFEVGHSEGVPQQRRFYDEAVRPGSKDYKRTMVVVSDAMRYEVGAEVAERLARETKGSVELKSRQSMFPSVTEFGMAALLPQKELSYDWETGAVLADGMPTVKTPERQAVIAKAVPGAVALLSDELKKGNRAARKALVGEAPLVYVYHDKIDSTGEKLKLERDVFKACADTVDEVVALVKIAVNDLAFGRVIVTADHGFLYTRKELAEADKVGKADIGGTDAKLHRRHVLSREVIDTNLMIRMDMSDIRGGVYYGLTPRECIRIKSAGGNKNYVHGGVSLQETCVPVIELRNKRIGSKGRTEQAKAEMALVSTARRITSSMFHVDLFQREPVGGKVLPAEYELCMTDGSGNAVTDVQKAHADMSTADERARVARPMFTLKAGIDYPVGERYYLVCRDKETGDIAWQEEFTIDMAFAPTVDFGF